ncbi:FprA family A-type flavoprotein [Bacillus cereus]|nr:FprA family A-type flavoprotein [Bacillus cereus]
MNREVKLTEDIYWVGKIDDREVPFHRLILAKGTTYNAYLLKTEKPTVIDTVDLEFGREFVEYLSELIDPQEIQYIVVNHTEPDHSGGLAALASRATKATIVCTEIAVPELKEMYKLHHRNFLVVKDGDTLDIGGKTLKFKETPYLHTEETMITYCIEDKILFPCDIFSTHVANYEFFNDEVNEDITEDFIGYYNAIIHPHRRYVRTLMEALKELEVADKLMGRQLDEKTSLLLKQKIESTGVKVYLNTTIDSILGEEEVTGIKVNGDQRIACDSVVYSIGVTPNISLVNHTPIHVNRGIVVNEMMETNVESVYAAGDVAEVNGKIDGLWGRAIDQGKSAGSNMVSISATYKKAIPVTIFNAFDISLFSIGCIDEKQCDTTIVEEDGKEKYTRLFIKDNKIVGVISLEGVVASIPYKSAIEEQVSLEEINMKNTNISEIMSKVKEKLQS